MIFTELSQPKRIQYINDTNDVSVLFDLFSKHLDISSSELSSKLRLKGDPIMNRLYVFGDVELLNTLGNRILDLGIVPECCTNLEIRVDIYQLLDKMR